MLKRNRFWDFIISFLTSTENFGFEDVSCWGSAFTGREFLRLEDILFQVYLPMPKQEIMMKTINKIY
jgi:hypothetical protein